MWLNIKRKRMLDCLEFQRNKNCIMENENDNK